MANAGNIGLPSSDFTYWLPGIYFQRGPREHAPVSVQSDNQMPVPALGPNGKPAIMSGTAGVPGPVPGAAAERGSVLPDRPPPSGIGSDCE